MPCMRQLKTIGRIRKMSETVKCGICGTVAEGEDCHLMAVIVDEDGNETKVCCHHVADTKE